MIASIIIATAVVQLFVETVTESQTTVIFRYIFQVVFSIDIFLRIITTKRTDFRGFILNIWNVFDLVLTVLMWLPICLKSSLTLKFLQFLSVLRLLRVLKTFSFITDLGVILNSVSASTLSILYSLALLFLVLFYFSCAGTLLFHHSAPYHFSSVPKSFASLLQIMTLDNWSDLMWCCILGCRYFPYYNSGLPKFDSLCLYDPNAGSQYYGVGAGVGWWGAIFFVVFIIFCAMVLISLLVGIIITCMELLRQSVIEEREMWEKVRSVQKRYNKDDFTMNLLLQLFDSVDLLVSKELNGVMTFNEVGAIMELAELDESINQYEFFMKVDTDGSGQIDFAEFCEMIILIGNKRKDDSSKRRPTLKNIKRQGSMFNLRASIDDASGFMKGAIDFLTTQESY